MTSTEALKLLRDIAEGKEPASKKPHSLRGLSFAGEDMSRLDLANMDLSGVNFTGANLTHSQLFNSDLTGAILHGANLRRANLSGANLTNVNMDGIRAVRAGFGMVTLENATCFKAHMEMCTFSRAVIRHSDFRCSNMQGARFRESELTDSDFTEADLRACDFSLSRVNRSIFNNADMRDARFRQMSGYRSASWIGTDIRDINFSGAYLMRRFVKDQNYLKEFKERSRLNHFLFYIWKITSDCGRSMALWCIWIIILTLFFAWVYTKVGIDYGKYPTPLSAIYFSVVTFTTLGYGDIRPTTVGGEIAAMAEVIIGYMMLGGLLSILSNKMARRAD